MKVIREKEEDNLITAEWFYFDLPRQEAIEILKAKVYEICMKSDGHIFILPILFTENKYYIRKKIYLVGNESGLNSGLDSVNSGLNSVKFDKLHDLVTYYLEGNMLSKTLNKNQCKQEASKSSKEAYRTYCMGHFCNLCREFQTQIHFCNFSQIWQNFDGRNLLIIHGWG